MRKGLLIFALICVCAALMSAQAVRKGSQSMVPTGKGFGAPGTSTEVIRGTVNQGNWIKYHGGPVIPNTVNVYYIWYGNWRTGPKPSDSKTTTDLLTTFGQSIGGTPFEMINSTYGDTVNNVSGNINLAGQAFLPSYPKGKSLGDTTIQQIVSKMITSGKLPSDTNGEYFVFTTSDVNETSGFCTVYCGWHTHATIGGADIKYAFIGNPDRCSSACESQTISPNNDSGADGMANIMSHELEEGVSDPDLNAWYDSRGYENGDLCAWLYGNVTGTIGNGAYNETFGGKNWLLQMNFENARGGGCDNYLGGPLFPHN